MKIFANILIIFLKDFALTFENVNVVCCIFITKFRIFCFLSFFAIPRYFRVQNTQFFTRCCFYKKKKKVDRREKMSFVFFNK